MSDLMLFAEGLLSKQQVVDEFGIPTNLEPKLFAILKPRSGKLYFKKDVEPALEKVLGVNRPPFAEEEFSYEKENLKVNETYLAPESFERIAQGIERLIEVLVPKTSELVGTEYIASKIGKSKQWIGKMAERGAIPKDCIAPKVSGGRIWKFYRDKIDAWLLEQ